MIARLRTAATWLDGLTENTVFGSPIVRSSLPPHFLPVAYFANLLWWISLHGSGTKRGPAASLDSATWASCRNERLAGAGLPSCSPAEGRRGGKGVGNRSIVIVNSVGQTRISQPAGQRIQAVAVVSGRTLEVTSRVAVSIPVTIAVGGAMTNWLMGPTTDV